MWVLSSEYAKALLCLSEQHMQEEAPLSLAGLSLLRNSWESAGGEALVIWEGVAGLHLGKQTDPT